MQNNAGVSNEHRAPFELIRFDKKVKIYVGICAFLFLLFVAFKLHNSSMSLWGYVMSDEGPQDRGVIVGSPLGVRSDEWMVVTPFIVSQAKKGFPVSNPALGYGKAPLTMGLPTKHILSMLKPHLWGYYFLDIERGFSWHWNLKTFPFLIVSFLFLMLFTRNNFFISLYGTMWLFLSSAIQWWSINTEIFTYGMLTLLSFIYIVYSNKTRLIVINGIIFTLAAYSYAMILYPAYQVPLAWFLLALLVAFVISRKNYNVLWENKWVKLLVLAFSVTCVLSLVLYFFHETKETIQVISNTVYPGKRNETGGNYQFLWLFKDNFSWFMKDLVYPPNWVNSCELSSFLMLSPIASILIIYSWVKTKTVNVFFIPLLIFQAIVYTWFFIGFPEFIAKLTMFNVSTNARTFYIFGFANVVFTLLYLNQFRKTTENLTLTLRPAMAVNFLIILLVALVINYKLNVQADRFFSKPQFFNAAVIFAILNWLIVYYRESKILQYLFYTVCTIFIAGNIFVNPLCTGLSPFYDNKLFQAITEVRDKDPDAQWMTFGNSLFAPNYLKAAGANCFNGVEFAPPLDKLHLLDPALKSESVYNRYAHIIDLPLTNARDTVEFEFVQLDLYNIKMDPSSPRLKKMGIKYVFFTYKPTDIEVRDMVLVKEIFGRYIYKRKGL